MNFLRSTPLSTDILLVAEDTPLESYHPVIFECNDVVSVDCTKGAAGPSGMDAQTWLAFVYLIKVSLR